MADSKPVVWAEEQDQPETIINEDGSRTIISYRINDDGKKVKITQRIKDIIVKETVNKNVALRKKWGKYGAEKGSAPGPDYRTTQIGESVTLRLSPDWKRAEQEAEEEKKSEIAKQKTYQGIKCRTCGGNHYTAKCPFKDTLGSADSAGAADEPEGAAPTDPAVSSAAPGKYIPVHLRGKAGGLATEAEKRERDDSTTLRVTQLNENVNEQMLRYELFANFGPLIRANIVRNRETGRSKGVAYVQFATEEAAERALERLNGKGYHSLILHLEWSKPKK
ncbi:hypothetical protein WICMUC_002375 [Wickerhamomyces mucosus]|uniref:Eukaryotic translation initiation factor 3 subunit G n=1 Tax=Wickerhamomyces mucosus TaxID=1378264 RepID=A0A9P8PPL2_9ASCO|nr:hypothetical protein WICMUC_002375 [Wickerhamomyces mucosus]